MRDVLGKYLHFSKAIRYKNKKYDYLQIPLEWIKDERELLKIIQKSICFNNASQNTIKIEGNKRVFDWFSNFFKTEKNGNFYFAGFPFFLNPLLVSDDIYIKYDGYEEALKQLEIEEDIKKQKIKRKSQLNKMILNNMIEQKDIPYQWMEELSKL